MHEVLDGLKERAKQARQANFEAVKAAQDRANQPQLSRKRRERYEQELDRLDALEQGKNYDKEQAWHWTLEESLAWEAKQQAKKERQAASQDRDFNVLAERAYQKDIDLTAMQNKALAAEPGSSAAQPDAVDQLLQQLTHRDGQRKRRAAMNAETSFINDSNRRFNLQLRRASLSQQMSSSEHRPLRQPSPHQHQNQNQNQNQPRPWEEAFDV